jgi:hypothetical protein
MFAGDCATSNSNTRDSTARSRLWGVLFEQGRKNVLCDYPGPVLRDQHYNDPEGYSDVWKLQEELP